MKKNFLFLVPASLFMLSASAQDNATTTNKNKEMPGFIVVKQAAATPVKNQSATGTCWSFSTTSLVESQALKSNLGEFDISEMFTVRNIYKEKARNYILRQGHAQFSEGGLGHDVIRAIATYGAMPESVYSGLKEGQFLHNHKELIANLKKYLDGMLHQTPLPLNWMDGFTQILDDALGKPPAEFEYKGVKYTPLSFAKNVLQFNANDYVNITSFTDHPYYEPFIIQVPDNFSNGAYINLPLDEMIQVTKDALTKGYTVLWDADVSNSGFKQNKGVALLDDTSINAFKKVTLHGMRDANNAKNKTMDPVIKKQMEQAGNVDENSIFANGGPKEVSWDADLRQTLYEKLITQDDHLMHITGLEKGMNGENFFKVKNSWGNVGPDKGYIHVSEPYFAINTISLIIPKAAISAAMLEKMKVR